MNSRRKALPSPWAMLFLAVCCVLSMIITYRAGAQTAGTRPPPSKAEESATIEDDETLVPDSKESADNNVTFPIDI